MTHYWWMHWFWITVYLYSVTCNSTITQHVPIDDLQVKNESYNRISKSIGGSSNVPPIPVTPAKALLNTSTTLIIPVKKPNKSPSKKIDNVFPNATGMAKFSNSSNTTIYPLFKETTVIDQNVTDFSLNNTDNHTLINASFNAISHDENLTYVGDYNSNRTEFSNSEYMGLDNDKNSSSSLSAAGITGITFGCVAIVGVICAASFFMYRNRGFNRPQVLNDRCSNPDSSGYIDDASVRDNSEEMYSLDNDSFLNSLEAMTIQNYFTDTVKHTKL